MITSEMRQRIDALKPWFHTIELDNGDRIERDPVHGVNLSYPAGLWKNIRDILPVDVHGSKVLDVGCNGGFFSLEMKRLGASYVLGLEAFPQYFEQAKLVREISGIDIDLRCVNVYEVAENLGQFDITLFLGVLYHLKHPILALENLAKVTSGILVIESAVLPETARGLPNTRDYGGKTHQLAYVENTDGVEGLKNWFVPSVSGMEALVRTAGFKNILAESVYGERVLLIAAR